MGYNLANNLYERTAKQFKNRQLQTLWKSSPNRISIENRWILSYMF